MNLKGNLTSKGLQGSIGKSRMQGILGTNPAAIPISVDNALSLSSTNPVQNKVITQAITNRLLSDEVKDALLQIVEKVAYIDADGQDYYDALYDALYPPTNLDSIGAVFDSSATIYNTDTLDDLKQYLTVTAYYTDGTSETVTTYTLSGSMDAGTQTITVSYGGKTTTFTVTIIALEVTSIDAVFTQGSATIYDTDSLDTLKQYLVVTATYSDSSTAVVSDYTLSGTLTAGTSTITVSYGGQTDTFDVTVTARYELYDYIYNSRSSTTNTDEYVNTGLKHSPSWTTFNIEYEAMNTNTTSAGVPVMGANNTSTSANGNLVWLARASKAGFSTYSLGVAKQLNTVPGDTRAIIKYFFVDGGQSYIQWGDTVVDVATVASGSISNNNKSLLLAGSYAFSSGNPYGMVGGGNSKIGYIKFTDPATNNLAYHFIPAHDVVANKYGFYEAVNKVFYPSNGSYFRCANWEA